jgi:hypothetical protein
LPKGVRMCLSRLLRLVAGVCGHWVVGAVEKLGSWCRCCRPVPTNKRGIKYFNHTAGPVALARRGVDVSPHDGARRPGFRTAYAKVRSAVTQDLARLR